MILHPGFGNIEHAVEFLQEINDERILIENMPMIGLGDENLIGHNPDQIKMLIDNKFGFCLDLNHAVKAAISQNMPYQQLIDQFIKLGPKVLHIADGMLDQEKDEHLDIGKGEYDFKFLMNSVLKSRAKYLTLETPKTSPNSDLENLDKLKRIVGQN